MSGALSEALVNACRANAVQTAIVGDDSDLRYRDIAEQARAVAATLRAAGVEADEPVHVHVSNQPLDIAAILGIWLVGGVAVPVHRTTPSAVSDAFASGWMQLRGARRRRSVDRGFVLSDHADWPGLLKAVGATGAQRVLLTHGYVAVMVRWLQEHGFEAHSLDTEFGADEDEASGVTAELT